jgi:hypothetical protein
MWLLVLGLGLTLPATRDDLCSLADAEVTSQECEWLPGPEGRIGTRTWLAVQPVRGLVGDTVEVVSDGGRIGEVVMWVEDEPELRLDHRYLLLLQRDGNAWRVVSGAQGAWPLAHGVAPRIPEACRVAR